MPTLEQFDVLALRAVVTSFRDAVRSHAEVLNLLNVYPVPDGDTGTNMARTLDAVVAEMEAAGADLEPTCDAISHGSLMGARGNSGVILSQILRGVASTLKADVADGTATRVAAALMAASSGAYEAVLKPVEGTILTVVRESAAAADRAAAAGAALADVLDAAHLAGREALERTPELLPALRDAGVVDAGGAGFLLLLDAALHVVTGRPLPEPDLAGTPTPLEPAVTAHRAGAGRMVAGVDGGLDVGDQRFEVMYFCELDDASIHEFKQSWGRIGDSIVVVGGDGLWNCHVHTNDIGAAIEVALDLGGRPRQIRVTDLFDEVADEHAHREALMHGGVMAEDLPPAVCAVVAVSSGHGISELFRALGVQVVVSGGQTTNPSTAELLEAVDRCNADQVVILPNNKNIIPVAEQVQHLTAKTVEVVPTFSMPEGLAALVVLDPDEPAAVNADRMGEATDSVVTGEVTCAIRTSHSPVGPVALGDWIGLARGDGIVAVAPTIDAAVRALLERMLGPERELLTVLTGTDADPAVTEGLVAWLAAEHAAVEVEVHHGGQPLYPYLFGAE